MPSSGSHSRHDEGKRRQRSYSPERDVGKRKEDYDRRRHHHNRSSRSHQSSHHRDRYDEDERRGSSSSSHKKGREDGKEKDRSHRSRSPQSRSERSREENVDEDRQKKNRMDHRSEYSEAKEGSRSQKSRSSNGDTGKRSNEHGNSSTQLRRDDWMLSNSKDDNSTRQFNDGESITIASNGDQSNDYFANFGTYSREKKPKPDKPNPDELKISSRELNMQFVEGKHIDDYEDPRGKSRSTSTPGGPGSQWRMMKLRRVYEAAEEEGREVEEIALKRYGSMDAFNEARVERQFLDDQQKQIKDRSFPQTRPESSSRLSSRHSSFRKPGQESGGSTPDLRDQSREIVSSTTSKSSTPIPNVFQPTFHQKKDAENSNPERNVASQPQTDFSSSNTLLSAAELNKLSAKVLRAEMMGSSNAKELREQFERQKVLSESATRSDVPEARYSQDASNERTEIHVLPTLDARGRLYDLGDSHNDGKMSDSNRQKDGKRKVTDEEEEKTLEDLVKEERFGAGSATQKSMDSQMADRIMNDKSFKGTVDYMDDNVDRLSRKKMKSDAMKRMFAVQDYAKTKRVLDSCPFCWQEDQKAGNRNTIVSSGTRAFLALPENEPLTKDHTFIVPMQHHLSMLEADDDTWEEVKNFMKCIIQMEAKNGKGVVFYETIQSLKHQKHAFIEAVPIDQDLFTQLPAYFRQSILEVSDEWGQNKGLIEFSKERPFRACMVPNLPYFMVQWDHRGEKGYGHVIEESGNKMMRSGIGEADGFDDGFDDTLRAGSSFPHWFAAEVIGTLLEYEPKGWRKPRRLHREEIGKILQSFQAEWTKYDWTRMIN